MALRNANPTPKQAYAKRQALRALDLALEAQGVFNYCKSNRDKPVGAYIADAGRANVQAWHRFDIALDKARELA